MNKFNFRIGDFEVRTTGEMLLSTEPHVKAEIVKWLSDDHCYTIGIFEPKKEHDWDIRLLGHRVEDEDFKIIGKLIKLALNELFAYDMKDEVKG